jgi:hypothetical protein
MMFFKPAGWRAGGLISVGMYVYILSSQKHIA